MADAETNHSERQSALWNGPSGNAWVDLAPVMDRMLAPIAGLLVAAAEPGDRVLDVGCGTGATTVALARQVGEGGSCLGVDISESMIEAARSRLAEPGEATGTAAPRFLVADAGGHRFDPGGFDLLTSRFGVMFFADPEAAFANLLRAMAEGGRLRVVVWRSPEENEFMTLAPRTAAPLLELPRPEPGAPGQFAFGDPARVREILAASDWSAVEIEPVDFALDFPLDGLVPYLTRLGPVGNALRDADRGTRERVVEALLPAYERFVDGDRVRFTAACWSVGARADAAAA